MNADRNTNYLTGRQVQNRYQISHMTLYRWEHDAGMCFPSPMVINRRKFFKEADLVEWERERARASA
ncbi:DNA-binding protein [Rhizobium sp. EC-SD404]|uniref:helix-turn-helix transcriptional regulator n=1 Tax=Rhizobium sp. EC-SD404 TaxID=2038389 RepID=UPI00125218A9|nr:DNA-binding protein [Rhizobium sp. EC-SD404]VVT04701.1 conserved hypothetical protein [Rhizobium sp. EC-SD404]